MSRPMPHLISLAGGAVTDVRSTSIGEWDRARTGLWSMSGLAILALHLGAALILALWVPHVAEPPLPVAAMMIDLAPLPTPPAAPPAPKPPEPKPPEPKPVVKPVEPLRKPVVKPQPAPPVKPAPMSVPDPAASQPIEPPPQAQSAAAAAASVPAPPSGNAKPTWQGLLLGHLERYKRYPATARARRQEGVATVRFLINRNGEVLSVRLERGSGSSSLDEEALALPERAQPLPPPPPEVKGEQIELMVPIQFFLR